MSNGLNKQQIEDLKKLLAEAGSMDFNAAIAAQRAIAAALSEPIRSGILAGDIVGDIFEREVLMPGAVAEYEVSLFRPDNDQEYVAFTLPNTGRIPQRHVEGDYVQVPTFDVGNAIDFNLRYMRESRFDVMKRALEVMEAGVIQKNNDDGWHTLLAAGVFRNLLVSDANAAAGQFTKRLISLLKVVMRRNAGGNSASVNRGRLTHLYISPEAMEDVRNWGLDEADDITRREIYQMDEMAGMKVFGVTLVDLDELGENQSYNNYFLTNLGGSLAASDVELAVAVDLSTKDAFVNPVRDEFKIFEDQYLHRENRAGWYTRGTLGWAVLNSTRILLGSL